MRLRRFLLLSCLTATLAGISPAAAQDARSRFRHFPLGPVTYQNSNPTGPDLVVDTFRSQYGLGALIIKTTARPGYDFDVKVNNRRLWLRSARQADTYRGRVTVLPWSDIRVVFFRPGVSIEVKIIQWVWPLADWNFNEGSADHVGDTRGRFPGTASSSPPWEAGAMRFINLFDEVVVPHDSRLNPGDRLTIEALIRPDGAQSANVNPIVLKNGNTSEGYGLLMLPDNTASCFMRTNPGLNLGLADSAAPLSVGDWHHVACVFDGSTYKIYVDNVPVPEATVAIGGSVIPSSSELTMGGDNRFGRRNFNGAIGHVRLSDLALIPKSFLLAGTTGPPGLAPGPSTGGGWDDHGLD